MQGPTIILEQETICKCGRTENGLEKDHVLDII